MNECASVKFLFGLLCANYQKLGFNILLCDKLDKSESRYHECRGIRSGMLGNQSEEEAPKSCQQLQWSDRVTKQGKQLR